MRSAESSPLLNSSPSQTGPIGNREVLWSYVVRRYKCRTRVVRRERAIPVNENTPLWRNNIYNPPRTLTTDQVSLWDSKI